jgi:hypothetical protein
VVDYFEQFLPQVVRFQAIIRSFLARLQSLKQAREIHRLRISKEISKLDSFEGFFFAPTKTIFSLSLIP